MTRPGSALWLLRHEVRMFIFNSAAAKSTNATRGLNKRAVIVFSFLFLGLHGLAFLLLKGLPAAGEPPQQLVVIVTLAMAALMTMMMSSGLKSSVEVLFERGDLDLLLSSPLPTHSIFVARLAGITVGIAGLYLFFLAPFAHMGLALGQFRLLGIYPAILSMALLAASLSMLLTLALVRWLGVRRTRVVAQILGAFSGAFIFLVSQSQGKLMRGTGGWFSTTFGPLMEPGALLGPTSLVWLPGRGALGTLLPALLLSVVGIAAFVLTARFTHRFFVHGLQQAVSAVRVSKAPTKGLQFRFGRSLPHAVIVKEWRLIARDPTLISQVLLQLLYMLPICVIVVSDGKPSLPGIGASLAFLCGSLTAALGWIILSAEEAPDLLRAAPARMATIRRAKLAAVVLPTLAVVVLPLLWLATRDPLPAALMLGLLLASTLSAGLIVMWCGRPAVRGDFKNRGKANVLGTTLEVLTLFGWAAVGYLGLSAVEGPLLSMPFLIGAGTAAGCTITVLAVAFWFRYRSG